MDWFSDKVISQLWVTIIGGLIAGLAVLLVGWLFKVVTGKAFRNGVWPRLKAWYNRIRLYGRLSAYDRDILKSLYDSKATRLSRHYDDGRPPSIQTKLDYILDTPVACRLILSCHYHQSVKRLIGHGFIKWDERWLYEEFTLETYRAKHYQLTDTGYNFIHKHTVGLNWREKFIRKWLKGLSKHQYEGCYRDEVGREARGKFPKLLQGLVFPKRYMNGQWIGSNYGFGGPIIHIYQYPPGGREDGVEWVVAIRSPRVGDPDLDIAQNDSVFLLIRTDDWLRKQDRTAAVQQMQRRQKRQAARPPQKFGSSRIPVAINRAFRYSNKPQHLEFDPRVVGLWEAYPVQAEVFSVEESDDRLVTVLNLGEPKVFDPSVEHERNQSAEG